MKHVILPKADDAIEARRLPFYLAMEEWTARSLPEDDYFFTWRVNPTVIFGRNQNVAEEVDIAYCLGAGIEFYRRKSGGGCVYADMDNIMLSYVCPCADVEPTFARYTDMVVRALRSLGLDAVASGRNDILVDGRKVSGGAFYRMPGRSVAHSTMLFDTNMPNMLRAITPSRAKLESHGVKSVEARVTTIRPMLPGMTIEEFNDRLISFVTDSEITLTPAQVAEIEVLEREYYRPEWTGYDIETETYKQVIHKNRKP